MVCRTKIDFQNGNIWPMKLMNIHTAAFAAFHAKRLETASVHGWSTLHVLGPSSAYSQSKGLNQDGFLPGRNMLHVINMKVVTKPDAAPQEEADKLGTFHSCEGHATSSKSNEHF